MQHAKTQVLKSILLIAVIAVFVFLGPTAWQNTVRTWKVTHAVATTYHTQYLGQVVTVGKRLTGLTYVVFNVRNDEKATYQGPFANRLISEMSGLKTGDRVVFESDSTFSYYGKNRELVRREDRVKRWSKIP